MGLLRDCIFGLVFASMLCAHAATAQGYRFTARVGDTQGGASLTYLYDGEQVTVTQGSPQNLPVAVQTVGLTPGQRVRLDALTQAAWDAELTGRFDNPNISDGTSAALTVADPDGNRRTVTLTNYLVPELADLLAEVNRVVAAEYRSGYPSAPFPLMPAQAQIVAGIDSPIFFAAEIERINRGSTNLGPVLVQLRRAVEQGHDQPARAAEARLILDAVSAWIASQERAMDRLRGEDLPSAYALARETSELLGRNPLSQPFDALIAELRGDRRLLREVEAELALREAKRLAASIGLDGDVEEVRWDDRSRMAARELGDRMDTITTVYRGTDAADEARETIALWRAQVRAIEARKPAWEYTWHIDLIPLGTEERVRLRTDYRGELVTEIDTEIIYDTRRVVMHGTFQNTSSEPHRYTFLTGVIGSNADNDPFATGDTDQMLGYERVQTRVLAPGELVEWSAEVSLRNIRQILRGGLGQVVADQPE